MSGSTIYFIILAILVSTVSVMQNQAVSFVFWSLLSAQSAVGAVIVLRRTHFRFFGAALALGAVASALLAGLTSQGLRFPFVPLPWIVCFVLLILAGPLCFYLESRRHPVEWKQLGESMKQRSALDILLFRHIPSS